VKAHTQVNAIIFERDGPKALLLDDGESSGSNNLMALANETKHGSTSSLPRVLSGPSESFVDQMEGGKRVNSIEEIIEKSKSHRSQVGEIDFDKEVAEVSNVELFRTLRMHPTWGTFSGYFGEVCRGWASRAL